jgi:hypothetical protein
MNLEHIVFESDAQTVVDAVHMRRGRCSEFSMIIPTIKNLLNLHSNFEVKFVKRQANSVAHVLDKAANFWARHRIFYLIPPYIDNLLSNEIN